VHCAFVISVISMCNFLFADHMQYVFNRYLVLDIADNPLENIMKLFLPVSLAVYFTEPFIGRGLKLLTRLHK